MQAAISKNVQVTEINKSLNAVQLAQKKRNVYHDFFSSIKSGGEFFSPEDIDIAIESLKFAQMDIKERMVREEREKEAELLKKKLENEKKRREAAQVRAAKRKERKRAEIAKLISERQLPDNFVNSYESDERANIHCDSIADALYVSIDSLGIVDIEFISSITGEEMKTVIEVLEGSIFQNPLHWGECFYKGWETAEEYLSGNLSHKLELAKQANEDYPGIFEKNIKAIEENIQPELDISDIYVTLGSPWVPTDIIDDFILHLVELDPIDGRYPKKAEPFMKKEYAVLHDEYTGIWDIPEKSRFNKSVEHGKYERFNYNVWGTNRMQMLTLLENTLNMKTLSVYDTVDKEKNTCAKPTRNGKGA